MDTAYHIIGADGIEYGPISLAGLQAWIDEGRVTRDMQVRRGKQSAWQAAEGHSELRWAPAAFGAPGEVVAASSTVPISPTSATVAAGSNSTAQNRAYIWAVIRRGASWFYWVAGLSAVNTVAIHLNLDFAFILGLGVTQVSDAVGTPASGGALVLPLIFDAIVLGTFAFFGYLAGKGNSWVFVVGMAFYALDAGLCGLLQLWLSLAFHLYVLYRLWLGLKANQARKALVC
jgi:hypothetical protein